jgi:hypothetical protein
MMIAHLKEFNSQNFPENIFRNINPLFQAHDCLVQDDLLVVLFLVGGGV